MIISLLSAKIVDQYVLRRKTQIGQNRVKLINALRGTVLREVTILERLQPHRSNRAPIAEMFDPSLQPGQLDLKLCELLLELLAADLAGRVRASTTSCFFCLSFDIRQPSPAKILLFAPSLGAESVVVLLIYLNAALQSAAFAEKATICKNIGVFVGERSDHDMIGREFALDGLRLPRLPAGRGGWRAPCVAELPTMLRTATGWTSTRSEPATLWVRPSLGHRPVADSHARS